MRSIARVIVGFLVLFPLTVATPASAAARAPHKAGGYVATGPYQRAAARATPYGTTPPTSVDLRSYAPPVGDQGQVGSCVSWSIARGMMGYWATRSSGTGAPYAPLYLYMRTVTPGGAPNAGTNPDYALSVAQNSGVDTQEDYYQGTTNWQIPPTAAQIANAANYRVSGWTRLWNGAGQGSAAQAALQQAMAAGQPVGIAFPVFSSFMYLGAHSLYTTTTGSSLGGHMVAAFAYDSQGVWLRNSWGANWGNGGDAKVSWAFINTTVEAAYTVSGISTPGTTNPVVPTIASMSPRYGSSAGGTAVTISGAGLASATGVSFGGRPATFAPVQVNDVTNLVATTPPGTIGSTVGVTVTNPRGTSAPMTYTYRRPAPSVSAVSPGTVSRYGGTTVTVAGGNLTGATSVLVGGRPATSVRVVSDSALTFVTPAQPAGTYSVRVTTPSGPSEAVAGATLSYASMPPTISAAAPSGGLNYTATAVVVTGEHFSEVTRVTVGGIPVSFTRLSGTQLRITAPLHAPGTVDIQVTTSSGISSTHVGTRFTYRLPPEPVVTSARPSSGLTYLSTSVLLTGANLTAASRVTADGEAVPFSRISATQLRVMMPAHAAGTVELRVTTPGGTSSVGADTRFTYTPPPTPILNTTSPSTGLTYLSTSAVLTGTGLTAASQVTVDGVAVPFSRISATQVVARLPMHAAGVVEVRVTTPGGTTHAVAFTYVTPPAPVVTSLSTATGLTYVSTPVVLRGTDLTAASRLTLGGVAVRFTRISATELRATFPPHAAGAVQVRVTTPGGTSDAVAFTYVAPPVPVATSLNVTSGYTYVGTTVVISGSDLTAASRVTVDGAAVSFSRISGSQVVARLVAHAAGVAQVRVTTPGGTSNAVAFTYVAPPAPAVTSLTPGSTLTSAYYTTVIIAGADLTAASRVTLGGTAVSFVRLSATTLRASFPRKAVGQYAVQVTTPGGVNLTGPASKFTYRVS